MGVGGKGDIFPEPGRDFLNYVEQKEKTKAFLVMKKYPVPLTRVSAIWFKTILPWKPRIVNYHLYPLNRHHYLKNMTTS